MKNSNIREMSKNLFFLHKYLGVLYQLLFEFTVK
jgi:hypothetical protein